MRASSRRALGVVALAASLSAPSTAVLAAPVPFIETTLTFAADCSWARVSIRWEDWRTNQIVLAMENPDSTQIGAPYVLNAGRDSGGFKASRSGGWSAVFTADWSNTSVKGFGGAYNTKGSKGGILDRTDPMTCVPE